MTILGITMSLVQGVLFIILGGVVLLAAMAGGVMLLAKLIFDETERVRRAQSKWDAKTKSIEQQHEEMSEHNTRLPLYRPTDQKARFVSSVELNVGDIVYLRTGQWRVIEKLNTALGMLIRLQSVTHPDRTSPNRVRQENVYDKVWSLRPQDWTK